MLQSGGAGNRGSGAFAEWKSAALQRCKREARLLEISRRGDRRALLEALVLQLETSDPGPGLPEAHFEAKQEARARQLLELGQLSEALAWAAPGGPLFRRILARRIWRSHEAGQLALCARDCQLMQRLQSDSDDDDEAAIEALLAHADCRRAMGEPEAARRLLNEAMRRVSELANGQADAKARILQSCLPTKPSKRPAADRQPPQPRVPPPLEGKPHGFLSCCSDALGWSRDRARGRFLYARRNIKPGSVLLVDRPFSFSTDLSALRTNCTNCHLSLRLDHVLQIPCTTCSTVRYCSEECSQVAWNNFHKFECQIFKYFYEKDLQKCNSLLAYRTVVAAFLRIENNQVSINEDTVRLHENDNCAIDVMSMDKYKPDDYQAVFCLETHCIDQQLEENLENAINSIFLAKCLVYALKHLGLESACSKKLETTLAVAFLRNMQAIKCNAYEIVENVRNEETKILEPRNVGGAIYTSVSLTNHSCYPNVVRHSFPGGVVVVTSLRFIPQGAEILDCYGQHFLEHERDHRRRHLKIKYYFECQCEACSFDWPVKLSGDKLRFKCKKCFNRCRKLGKILECIECAQKTDISKLQKLLENSVEKRIAALTKMYDGCYNEALPLLLEHANCIGKILLEPSLEAVKTQQSIIQCLNAMSSTSI